MKKWPAPPSAFINDYGYSGYEIDGARQVVFLGGWAGAAGIDAPGCFHETERTLTHIMALLSRARTLIFDPFFGIFLGRKPKA